MDHNKRQLMKASAMLPFLGGCVVDKVSLNKPASLTADEIELFTKLPNIPKQVFDVRSFGAIGDGVTDDSLAIKAAIGACKANGGGQVKFEAGVYLTGPIHLVSNMDLHLAKGAELSFTTDPDAYLPAVFTRWEGMEMMGLSPLIYAYGASDVAITGEGVINGNADDNTWWPWKGPHSEAHWRLIPGQDQTIARKKLFEMAEAGIPPEQRIFAEESFLRPPLVQLYKCNRVSIKGVTLKSAPFWCSHFVLCEDVTVDGVSFSSHGPNSDGCNPESSQRVVIKNCFFDTGDDCIAIKSGRNADGRRLAKPSRDLLVQDCQMRAGHGGVVLGSEISGGVDNLHVRRCEMNSPDLERAIRIKTNASRGGVLCNLFYSDISVGHVQEVIVINYYYEEGEKGEWLPLVDNVKIRNLKVENAGKVFMVRGFENDPIQRVSIENMAVESAQGIGVIENIAGLTITQSSVNGKPLTIRELK